MRVMGRGTRVTCNSIDQKMAIGRDGVLLLVRI